MQNSSSSFQLSKREKRGLLETLFEHPTKKSEREREREREGDRDTIIIITIITHDRVVR